MIELVGIRSVLETSYLLSAPFLEPSDLETKLDQHTQALRRYVSSIQPWMPPAPVRQQIGVDKNLLGPYLKAFNEESVLSDISYRVDVPSDASFAVQAERFSSHLNQISKGEPLLFDLLQHFIHTVFFAPSTEASGGTTSSAVGVLWVNSRDSWTSEDYIEFVVHELTHTLVFLDERRFGHYQDLALAVAPENFAQSAVLGRRRPVDKVLHSLIVATEIFLWRNRRASHESTRRLHPPTNKLVKLIQESVDSLKQLESKELLRPRARELYERCEEAIHRHV